MFERYRIILPLIVVFTLVACLEAFAWDSPGHKYAAIIVKHYLENNPVIKLSESDLDRFVELSSMPDSFTKWKDFKKYRFYPDETDLLNKHKIRRPYDFHSPQGQAVSFILLCNAIKKNRNDSKVFWMVSLLHSATDSCSLNHDPILHYIVHAYVRGYKLPVKKQEIDFCEVGKNQNFRKENLTSLNSFTPVSPAKSADETLLGIMGQGVRGSALLLKKSGPLRDRINANDSRKALEIVSELGMRGIENAITIYTAARHFSAKNQLPELTGKLAAEHDERVSKFLANESTAERNNRKNADIAIIVEPMRHFSKWKLSLSSSYFSEAIINCLNNAKIPVQSLNIYQLEQGKPIPANVSLLIVPAGIFRVDNVLKRQIREFRKRDGKLLWIGGVRGDVLGKIPENLRHGNRESIPVFDQYGDTNDECVKHAKISFLNHFASINQEKSLRFIHNPNTKVGAQRPVCQYRLNPDSKDKDIVILAKVENGDNISNVALAEKNGSGFSSVFLPEYLLAPYVYTPPEKNAPFWEPHLDRIGTEIILKSINILK